MPSLTVNATRQLDFFRAVDNQGNRVNQPHILAMVDDNGNLTDTIVKAENLSDAAKSAMLLRGIEFDDYGNAYYVSANLSRFIHYGIDSNGQLYAFNYAGDKLMVNRNGTLANPNTGVAVNNGTSSAFRSLIEATYDLNWNNVQANGLSLMRVIMLVTMIRAELIEEQLVEQMDALAARTALLQGSADVEQYILDNYNNSITNNTSFTYTDGNGAHTTTIKSYLTNVLNINVSTGMFPGGNTTTWSADQKDQIIAALQTRQDELNTISQETSINIQSLINKRDQSYLLGSNAISLFNSGHMNVARNI